MKSSIFVILIAACSSTDGGSSSAPPATPAQACVDVASALCGRFYACLSPAERTASHLPATEADCVAMVEARQHCSTLTAANACTTGSYDDAAAAACSDGTQALSCAEVRVPGFTLNAAVASCGEVCHYTWTR
jgi:hypothetical protein